MNRQTLIGIERKTTVSADLEAEQLYFSVFRKSMPEIIETRFNEACPRVFVSVEAEQQRLYEAALKNNLDLEAIEIAGRLTGKLPLLSAKINLIVFIAETLPNHQHFFVNNQSNFLLGFLSLMKGCIKTVVKLTKGLYLLRALKNV